MEIREATYSRIYDELGKIDIGIKPESFSSGLFCKHIWLLTDKPYVDYYGGGHTSIKCEAKKYIVWGLQYRNLVRRRKIADNWEGELVI